MNTTTELLNDHSAPARERGIIIWTRPCSHQQQVIIARRKHKEKTDMNDKGEQTEI